MDGLISGMSSLFELFGSYILVMLALAAVGLLGVGRLSLERRFADIRTLNPRQVLGWIVIVTLMHGIGLLYWGENTWPGYNGGVLLVSSFIYGALFFFSRD